MLWELILMSTVLGLFWGSALGMIIGIIPGIIVGGGTFLFTLAILIIFGHRNSHAD